MVVGVLRQNVAYKIHAIGTDMIAEAAIIRPAKDLAVQITPAISQDLTFWLDAAIWVSIVR